MSMRDTVQKRLKKFDIHPSKGLGQNFLVSDKAYAGIIEAAQLTPQDTVIEVGPGLATLTELLATHSGRVIAIEKDRDLIPHLTALFENQKNVTIIEEDALQWNPNTLGISTGSYKVVANIPYYITSHLLRTIFEEWPMPALIVLMLQKEVAKRIVATPPDMSLLAVSVQYFGAPKLIQKVPAQSFHPAPNVDSAILAITPHKDSVRDIPFTESFFKLAKAGFQEKRKQLLNNFSAHLKLPREQVLIYLEEAHIDPKRRAETLTLEEWKNLTHIFFPQS